jgi:hypothetical protein
MSFVPVFVPPPPSARTKRLAAEIDRTVDGFRRKEPGTSESEVRRALQLAGRRAAGGGERTVALAVAIVMLLGGLLFFLFWQAESVGGPEGPVGSVSPDGSAAPSWLGQAVVGVLLVVFAVVLKKRR